MAAALSLIHEPAAGTNCDGFQLTEVGNSCALYILQQPCPRKL